MIDGSCFLEGTVAVRGAAGRCAPPSFNNPGCKPPVCEGQTKTCRTQQDCRVCGRSFTCEKCPPNGCPGRDVGTCVAPGELIFCTQELCIPPRDPPPPPPSSCKVGGCSGQLCHGPSEPGFSTCEFRPEFACYKDATCGPFGPGGRCGWKQTATLRKCLIENRSGPISFGEASISG